MSERIPLAGNAPGDFSPCDEEVLETRRIVEMCHEDERTDWFPLSRRKVLELIDSLLAARAGCRAAQGAAIPYQVGNESHEDRVAEELAGKLSAALAQVASLREALHTCHDEARRWQEGDDDDAEALAAAGVMSMAVCKASGDVLARTFAAAQAFEQRVRREERERCAKVADEHRENAKQMERASITASVVRGARLPMDRDDADVCRAAAANAANIAAAIRAEAGDGS